MAAGLMTMARLSSSMADTEFTVSRDLMALLPLMICVLVVVPGGLSCAFRERYPLAGFGIITIRMPKNQCECVTAIL